MDDFREPGKLSSRPARRTATVTTTEELEEEEKTSYQVVVSFSCSLVARSYLAGHDDDVVSLFTRLLLSRTKITSSSTCCCPRQQTAYKATREMVGGKWNAQNERRDREIERKWATKLPCRLISLAGRLSLPILSCSYHLRCHLFTSSFFLVFFFLSWFHLSLIEMKQIVDGTCTVPLKV